jgi:hypothetical protein
VNGSSSAMAMDGEMPGSAPPNIPQITPKKAAGMAQPLVMPWKADANASMDLHPAQENANRHGDMEQSGKDQPEADPRRD